MCVECYVVCLCLFILCHDKVLTSDEGQDVLVLNFQKITSLSIHCVCLACVYV